MVYVWVCVCVSNKIEIEILCEFGADRVWCYVCVCVCRYYAPLSCEPLVLSVCVCRLSAGTERCLLGENELCMH